MPRPLPQKYGPYALITGASSGLGAEFARQLARHGLHLILVARRASHLNLLAQHLRTQHNIHVLPIPLDLTSPTAISHLTQRTKSLNIGLLINNAGIQLHGSFFHHPLHDHHHLINLNIRAVLDLAYIFGRRFSDRRGGGILFVSSISRGGMPWFATYTASKAFVSTLALVLTDELKSHNVDVMVLEPGLVATEMTLQPGQTTNPFGTWLMPVQLCVTRALDAMGTCSVYTPGLCNRILKWLYYALPRRFAIALLSVPFRNVLDPHRFQFAPDELATLPDAHVVHTVSRSHGGTTRRVQEDGGVPLQ